MKILILGSGKGSWAMRGLQLGTALGARVTSTPSEEDLKWADLVVLVKRAYLTHGASVKRLGIPVVWDAVDFWSQPAENRVTEAAAIALLNRTIETIKPRMVICTTKAMAEDCGGFYLPHHSWAGLKPLPAREKIQSVAYEGNPTYLDHWYDPIVVECGRRGWSFVVNPTYQTDADIVVAFRGGVWDGWPCRQWKSGVKLVNAIASGRPVITQRSAAMDELNPCGTVIEDPRSLSAAFDEWESAQTRHDVVKQSLEHAPSLTVEAVGEVYRGYLSHVLELVA